MRCGHSFSDYIESVAKRILDDRSGHYRKIPSEEISQMDFMPVMGACGDTACMSVFAGELIKPFAERQGDPG